MSDTLDRLAALILERLGEGEACLEHERVVGRDEADALRRDFAQAEAAIAALVAVARAADRALADVDEGLADQPGGHDAYIRTGARFLKHRDELADALAALDAPKETRQ